jgi:hypothetical protein
LCPTPSPKKEPVQIPPPTPRFHGVRLSHTLTLTNSKRPYLALRSISYYKHPVCPVPLFFWCSFLRLLGLLFLRLGLKSLLL